MHVINQRIVMLLHAGRVTTSCHGNSFFLHLVREVLMDAPVNCQCEVTPPTWISRLW